MFEKLIARIILIAFFFISIGPVPNVSAQTIMELPAPGVMISTSGIYQPLQLKGILINVKNPLSFDFLVDKGDSNPSGQSLNDGITRLAKYFLTCLAVPEDDLWVNLSPYEKDRIVPGNFGFTLMGNDLLAQDYLLKQMMASLSYPENDLGKRFWQRVYRKSYELYGTTNIPINTFNKVWILPKTAKVYVQGNSAFVVNSQLDVMLEADYKAFIHHLQGTPQNSKAYSQVFRDVILPELRLEINEGKNFAVVRQVYNAMILATWYKRHLKDSLLGRRYVGKNQVNGVDIADRNAKEEIYQQYLKAYKKCVYNYIKEDYDPMTQQTVPHKYASGGILMRLAASFGVQGTGVSGTEALYTEEAKDPFYARLLSKVNLARARIVLFSAAFTRKKMADQSMFGFSSNLQKIATTVGLSVVAAVAFGQSSGHAASSNVEIKPDMSKAQVVSVLQQVIDSQSSNDPDTLRVLSGVKNELTVAQKTLPETGAIGQQAASSLKLAEIKAEIQYQNGIIARVNDQSYASYYAHPGNQLPSLNNGNAHNEKVLLDLVASMKRLNNISGNSITVSVTPASDVEITPKATIEVGKDGANKYKVRISWKTPHTKATEYTVERGSKPDSGSLKFLTKVNSSAAFTDYTVTQGNTYYYKINGKDANNNILFTLSLIATTPGSPPAAGSPPPPPDVEDMPLNKLVGKVMSDAVKKLSLDSADADALGEIAKAPERGSIQVGPQLDIEKNPPLGGVGLGVTVRTNRLIDPTRAFDVLSGSLGDEQTKITQITYEQGKIAALITALQQYKSSKDDYVRLGTDQTPEAKTDLTHQVRGILSMSGISVDDVPLDKYLAISDLEVLNNIQELQSRLVKQGLSFAPTQGRLAGLALQTIIAAAKNKWMLNHRTDFERRFVPMHIDANLNLFAGLGGPGSLLGAIPTLEYVSFGAYDAKTMGADPIVQGANDWQSARATYQQQLIDALNNFRLNQKNQVATSQLALLNMGFPVDELGKVLSLSNEGIVSLAKSLTTKIFSDGLGGLAAQEKNWRVNYLDHHPAKNETTVLAALDTMDGILSSPVAEQNPSSAAGSSPPPPADVTAGAPPLPSQTYTMGAATVGISQTTNPLSSASPLALTAFGNPYLNYSIAVSPSAVITGWSNDTVDLRRQVDNANNLYKGDKGTGPADFLTSIYALTTAEIIARDVIPRGQGFNFTQLVSLTATLPYDKNLYAVASPIVLSVGDALNRLAHPLTRKFQHKGKDKDAYSDIAASQLLIDAQVKKLKFQAMALMDAAKADPKKAKERQAWQDFFAEKWGFIKTTQTVPDPKDNKKTIEVPCPEIVYTLYLLSKDPDLKSYWEKGPSAGDPPEDLKEKWVDLQTAHQMLDHHTAPAAFALSIQPLLVWTIGSAPALFTPGGGIVGGYAPSAAKRAQIDLIRAMLQADLTYEEADAAWRLGLIDGDAGNAAKTAVERISSGQTDNGPTVVEIPRDKLIEVAKAASKRLPVNALLVQIDQLPNEPRTVNGTVTTTRLFLPTGAPFDQTLASLSVAINDDLLYARKTETRTSRAVFELQGQAESNTAVWNMVDADAQERFAMSQYHNLDTTYKLALAKFQAMSKAASGVYSKSEIEEQAGILKKAEDAFLLCRTQIESASRTLQFYLSGLNPNEQQNLGIGHVRLLTAPIPTLNNPVSVNLSSGTISQLQNGWPLYVGTAVAGTDMEMFGTLGSTMISVLLGLNGQPFPQTAAATLDHSHSFFTQNNSYARDGGINMNSRLLQLDVAGEDQNNIGMSDNAMSGAIIKGIVPHVSEIVTVTPNMLKAMLGAGYLN